MNITMPPRIGHVGIRLEEDEVLHLLHPKSLAAFQGPPANREDRIMNLAHVYRKRKWIRSRLQGAAQLVLALPPGCSMETVSIPAESNLLFDYRHVMFFTDGMKMDSRIQTFKNIWITREWVRMKFSGPGELGILSAGEIVTLQLREDVPLFVEAGSLVAYPENAQIRLSVYGNPLASQHMNVQWELRGSGPVLMQTGSTDTQLADQLNKDGLFKRLLRELLPFGGVYIK